MTGDDLGNQQTEIHHCEFVRGLDLLIVGQSFNFHHNVVDEMQDDALAIGFGSRAAISTRMSSCDARPQ